MADLPFYWFLAGHVHPFNWKNIWSAEAGGAQ